MTNSYLPVLLDPIQVRGVTIRNRIVLSPMLTYQASGGHITPWHRVHLGKFAQGGVGLVFMESTKVDPRGCTTPSDAGIWSDEFVPALRELTDFLHSLGASAGIQLGHSGRKARNSLPWDGRRPLSSCAGVDGSPEWELIAPSALSHYQDGPVPSAMTKADIAAQRRLWREAARRADTAGFDVLEVHGAHGYLLHQFLSPAANTRSDEYGGSVENRCRFPMEILSEVREVWPQEKPIFLRVSSVDERGWSLADTFDFIHRAKASGVVDVVDCSSGGMGGDSIVSSHPSSNYGYQVPYAQAIKRECDIKTMAVGLIVHPEQANDVILQGQADLVALGRELLFNPNWAMDAGIKLGAGEPYGIVPRSYGYWLEKRARAGFGRDLYRKHASAPHFHTK